MALQRLTINLLKNSVTSAGDALRAGDDVEIQELELAPELGEGRLFLQPPQVHQPWWADLLREAAPAFPEALLTSSAGALLVINVQGRWYALPFGYGRTLLDPTVVQEDFGLYVVLNAVDPDSLSSVDAKTLEEAPLLSRRQLGQASSITAFGLDLQRDLVQAVTGVPQDAKFAVRATGRTAVLLHTDVTVDQIRRKCQEAYRYSRSRAYKDRFAFVDHLQRVTDPVRQAELDEQLDLALAAGRDVIHLAAPEIVDEETVAGFRYSTERPRAPRPDLRWSDYLATLRQSPSVDLTRRRHRVHVIGNAENHEIKTWSLYRCLVAELIERRKVNILSGGQWFEVERDFATRTRTYVESLERTVADLPAANRDEKEGPYNERAKDALGNAALLMDRRLFRATESQDPIEVCDLFLGENRLVHVKKKYGSSTLSHLFQQGFVSAQLLQLDDQLRADFADAIEVETPALAAAFRASPFDPRPFSVVFGVIAPPARGGRHFLPFFSQVAFTRVAQQLRARGYDVVLTRIHQL